MVAPQSGDWDLLSLREQNLLAALAAHGDLTPDQAAAQTGMSRQAAALHAKGLKGVGLIAIDSYPKMTIYRITPDGENAAADGKARQ
jgi:predicted ArsR family transcriptional regulator